MRGVVVQVGVFALIFATSIAVTAAHLLVKRRLQLDWRAWLTERLIGRWMESGRHYHLPFVPGEHDNPDQRIADDIRIATESAVSLAHTFVYSLLTLGLFVEILWTVSGSISLGDSAIRVPGYMVPLAFLYAGAGTVLGHLLGRPLVRSTNFLQTAEANFRFGLARARERSEAIALMRGEPSERRGAAERFARIVRDWDRQSLAFMGLVSFSTGYGGLLPVFPLLVAAPQYIAGAMSLGALMQAAQAFQRLTSALSWPVDNVGEIANWRTSTGRVLSLDQAIERLEAEARAPSRERIALAQSEEDRKLVIDDLCIAEPSGQILLEHWSAEIRRGERVLIGGDPALTGSFFKVIGGLWPWGSGRVTLPLNGGIHFVPQRPSLPEGTLREALCYPRPADAFARGRAPPGARVHRPRLARAPARRAGQVGAGPAAARAAAARHRARAAAAPGLGVHGRRDQRARSEARAADPGDADSRAARRDAAPDQLPPRAGAAVPAQARAAAEVSGPDSLKALWQPAALDALAEAPGGRRLGPVAPEEPAQVVLERVELRRGVAAIDDVLLERVHAGERVSGRALGGAHEAVRIEPEAPLARDRGPPELALDRVGLVPPVERRAPQMAWTSRSRSSRVKHW